MTGHTSAVDAEAQHSADGPTGATTKRARGRRRPLQLSFVTLVVGLIITGVLTAVTSVVYHRNEHRLLRLRARDASALVTTALASVQTPLASAAELADATGGSATRFRAFAAAYVGSRRTFASMSIWDLRDPNRGPVAVAGLTPQLVGKPSGELGSFFAQVGRSSTLSVIGLLNSSRPGFGYGYATSRTSRYAAYAESFLPASRYAPVGRNSPFAGMRYALYFAQQRPRDLLLTNVRVLPLSGSVVQRIPFGDSAFVLVMAAPGSLAGALPQQLPWIIAVGGVLLTLAAAAGTMRLSERRLSAERLADELDEVATENRQLYAEQRTIARTLQHALLPEQLPQLAGVESAGEYQAGERSVDIGGDWYDVVALGRNELLLVVGDVSGRGLRAGTTMASLRFAIHAYAAEEHQPELILLKLSKMLSLRRERQLATVLCARIDVTARQVTVASAGHLPALLVAGGEARYLQAPVGVPIGVEPSDGYHSRTVSVPARATLLAYTDGLVERPGEQLDVGLERLRNAALRMQATLPELVAKLVADPAAGEAKDDIAIVGLRWTN